MHAVRMARQRVIIELIRCLLVGSDRRLKGAIVKEQRLTGRRDLPVGEGAAKRQAASWSVSADGAQHVTTG